MSLVSHSAQLPSTYHSFHVQSTARDLLFVRSKNRFVPVFRLLNHFRPPDSHTGVGGHCRQIDMSVRENIEIFVDPGRRGITNARCLCFKNHSFAPMVYGMDRKHKEVGDRVDTYVVLIEFNPPSPPNSDEFTPLLLFDICDLRKLAFVHVPRKTILLGIEYTDEHPVPHDDVCVLGGGLEVLLEDRSRASAGAGLLGRDAGEDFGGRCGRRFLYIRLVRTGMCGGPAV